MDMKQKISVIVPVYKVEAYLNQCINSIIAQTYKNLEIILVDDGSPDNCGKVCDECATKDNRIIVIHKKNGGVSSARNAGLDIATGEYISFIDSDDWIEADMFESLHDNLVKYDADVSCCGHYISYKNSNKTSAYLNEILIFNSKQAIKQMLLNKYIFCSACGRLYKKSFFDNIRFPHAVSYGEDASVTIDILSAINRIICIDAPKYYYRQRRESTVHITYSPKKMEIIYNAKKILKVIENNCPEIIDFGRAGLLKANLDVLSRMISSKKYKQLPEYEKILSTLRENYKFMLKSNVLNRNDKIKIIAIKINIRLYKLLQSINDQMKSKILF